MKGFQLNSHIIKWHLQKVTDGKMENGLEWQEMEEKATHKDAISILLMRADTANAYNLGNWTGEDTR